MTPQKVLLSWSSGKDSAWALHTLQQREDVEVVGLITTLNQKAQRVAMHAVREKLLEAQAEALGLPLTKVYIPSPCTNDEYEATFKAAMLTAKEEGVEAMAYGDLYLEDVLEPLFPIWGIPTEALSQQMVAAGLRAHITCVDPKQLDPDFVGRVYNADFLSDLPETVDPCGENGEFHSFVFEGPMFCKPLAVIQGERVERSGFFFGDLRLAG